MTQQTPGDVGRTTEHLLDRGYRRPRLTLPRLLAAALDVAREIGADRLTMKDVAARLEVGTMSLYHYVPDRATLLTHMVGEVYGSVRLPDPASAWDERLRSILGQVYLGFAGVPSLDPKLPLCERTLPSYERVADATVAALGAGGLGRADADRSAVVLLGYAADRGAATALHAQLRRWPIGRAAGTADGDGSSPRDPVTAPAAAIGVPDDELFDYGLELLLAGLERHGARRPS